MAETLRLADISETVSRTLPSDVRPPPQHDTMRLSTGLAYLQGADGAVDISGLGKIHGMLTDVSAFLTLGQQGVEIRTGRASIFSPDGKWRGEGGDLYSDLRGLARGACLSWGNGGRWNPAVALYLRRTGILNAATVVAYRDRFQLLPQVRLGGEVTSDGATFLQAQYEVSRLELSVFHRVTRGRNSGRDQGVSGGVALGRGFALSGSVRQSDAPGDSGLWQLASFRIPIPGHTNIALERSWRSGDAEGATNALTLQLPIGPLLLIQRVQWGRTDYRRRPVPYGFDSRQSQSFASYRPGPWGTVNYQQSTQWLDDGRIQQWDELASTLQLGRHTSLELATAVPDVADPVRLRGRITQRLSPTLQLEAQYGRLSAFQLTRTPEREQSRLMITVRKTWAIKSPARGGDVGGRTIDQAGNPVAGALVSLGPYRAVTDEAGSYRFSRVPAGTLDLALDKDKLPVAYSWDENPRALTIAAGSRANFDLEVIPLSAIRGHVYVDRNHSGHADEGEGIPGVVVAVGGAVTATDAAGAYSFYNQPPGPYVVRLDVPRLAKGLAPVASAERQVELTGDRPLTGIDFILEEKDMPIIMREMQR